MIFPIINNENIVQIFDKTRISLEQTFLTPNEGEIVSISVQPETTESFYEIANKTTLLNVLNDKTLWTFDWVYLTEGVKTISVKIQYGNIAPFSEITKTASITIISEADDNLFSNDSQLIEHQHDILKYVTPGRSSWNFMHRRAQTLIIDELDQKGYKSSDGTKITKDQVIDITEVRELSIFKTLRLIFESISNSKEDYFLAKAKHWETYEKSAELKCYSRFDLDKDGIVDSTTESINNNVIVCGRS